MRCDNLNTPLLERVRFIRFLQVILPEANEKLLWLNTAGRCTVRALLGGCEVLRRVCVGEVIVIWEKLCPSGAGVFSEVQIWKLQRSQISYESKKKTSNRFCHILSALYISLIKMKEIWTRRSVLAYFSTQWAAVMTQFLLISAAPHLCRKVTCLHWRRDTCGGCAGQETCFVMCTHWSLMEVDGGSNSYVMKSTMVTVRCGLCCLTLLLLRGIDGRTRKDNLRINVTTWSVKKIYDQSTAIFNNLIKPKKKRSYEGK